MCIFFRPNIRKTIYEKIWILSKNIRGDHMKKFKILQKLYGRTIWKNLYFSKIYKGGPYEKYQLFHIIGGWWYLWFPLQIGKELYFQTPKNKGGLSGRGGLSVAIGTDILGILRPRSRSEINFLEKKSPKTLETQGPPPFRYMHDR